MSTKPTKSSEEASTEKIKTGGGTIESPDPVASAARSQERDKAFFDKLPNPCVYCGPSVRGVARQFTVYHGGIPDTLKDFIKEHPAAKGLLVSVERFALVRTRLETPGTGEYILFRKVREEL